MTITYTPDHYIKGLNIHSVRDLFRPAIVSADLDLTFRRQSKKSRLYKKAFLLLAFLEAAEGFTYTFDAHFDKHAKHCAMPLPLYIMEIEIIACKWHVAPNMLCTFKDFKSKFFQILRAGKAKSLVPKEPREVVEAETIEELQKLKGEFVREFSGVLSYLGHRGNCCDDTYPPENKRNDPQAGDNSILFPRTGESLPPFI